MNTYYSDSRKATEFAGLAELAVAVADDSNRGMFYDGPGSTLLEDWLVEGDVMEGGVWTVAQLAQEWDE